MGTLLKNANDGLSAQQRFVLFVELMRKIRFLWQFHSQIKRKTTRKKWPRSPRTSAQQPFPYFADNRRDSDM
jgi:hypothetical protein